jgi:hypothetical protein
MGQAGQSIQVVQAPKLAKYKGFIDVIDFIFNLTENYSEILVGILAWLRNCGDLRIKLKTVI